MSASLATLEKSRNEILTEVRDLAAKAEERGDGFTTDEQAIVVERLAKAKDIADQMSRIKAVTDVSTEIDEMLTAEQADDVNQKAFDNTNLGFKGPRRSVSQIVLKSAQYQQMMKAHGGRLPDSARVSMDPIHVGGIKSLLTGADHDNSAGALVQPDFIGIPEYRGPAIGGIQNLVTAGTTSSDRVEFAQVIPAMTSGPDAGKTVMNARGVAEATTDGVIGEESITEREAGLKPKSQMQFRRRSADVITVATWLPATRRSLSDAGQLRTLIDNFLRTAVAREFERMMIFGDKASPADPQYEEFDGVLNMTGVQNQSWAGNVVATARKMKTKVQKAGGILTAFAVSAVVDEALDLAQTADGRFISAGPWSTGPNTLWGVPRIVVPDLSDDVIIGGEWSTLVLWDREQTTIAATDSHADFFVRNLLAILAEARAAFDAFNPQLMCVGNIEDPYAPIVPGGGEDSSA